MERDYESLIPKKPPQGLMKFMQEEGKFTCGVLGFKLIGRKEAEARTHCENFGGDFRPAEMIKTRKGYRTALLWCSECGAEMLAEYVHEEGCGRYGGLPKGIRIDDDYQQTSGRYREGHEMRCPRCGEKAELLHTNSLHFGHSEQAFVVALTVEGEERLPVLTKWCINRHIYWGQRLWGISPFHAYVVDEKKIVKLAHYRRYMGGFYRLESWEKLKRTVDDLVVPYFYSELPDLARTSLENAKLPEYYAQSYEKGQFHPLAYIRLYQRHPNVENLITCGMGEMIGKAIYEDARSRNYSYHYDGAFLNSPRLRWIDWKKARPAQMLGLTKEQLRQAKADKWDAERYRFWAESAGGMRFEEAAELLRQEEPQTLIEMIHDGADLLRTVRYLRKQKRRYSYLKDYRQMAQLAELDLTQEVVAWPPHLQEAHDRVQQEVRYRVSRDCREQFSEMSARCAGLCWEHDGICIRPAQTPEELVQEGQTLHHCVGGYANSHAAGSIILFVRHARRPERSWYTLNVDVKSRKVLQLHGYENERSPKGKKLRTPQRVWEFVELWQKEVLEPFVLPKKQKKRRTGKSA